VSGQGIRALRDSEIEVTVGVLEEACRVLNETYFKYHETGLPFVTLKMAQSLDGRIATKKGSSQWISSPASLRLAHQWRATHDAVMVGVNTIIRDDPSLTVRLVKGRNPKRVIVDSTLRIPMNKRVLADGAACNTTVLTAGKADPERIRKIHALGARVYPVEANSRGEVDLHSALRGLARDGITSLLVEGGAKLATAFLKAGLVDKLVVVIGGKIIGSGIEAVGELGITDISQALRISIEKTQKIGEDLVVVARLNA
jgi:riboflavin-specific deaminase-like protein